MIASARIGRSCRQTSAIFSRLNSIQSRYLCSRPSETLYSRFWKWTTQDRGFTWSAWRENKTETAIIFTVFGLTGSSSVALVRPALKHTVGLDGTWRDGPWSYRIGSILLVSPMYAVMLIAIGTAVGRHTFFARSGVKILSRFVPKSVAKQIPCEPAKLVNQKK